MNLTDAKRIADGVVAEMAPYCSRVEVAGSIRRLKPDCRDVEIVAVPKWEDAKAGLFAEDTTRENVLHRDWAKRHPRVMWIKTGTDLVIPWEIKPDGKYWRGVVVLGESPTNKIKLDLFLTTAPQFGLIFLIRTGPADFSHRLVTKQSEGGWLPEHMRVQGGVLWRGDTPVITPEEQDVFDAIGRKWVPPEKRV